MNTPQNQQNQNPNMNQSGSFGGAGNYQQNYNSGYNNANNGAQNSYGNNYGVTPQYNGQNPNANYYHNSPAYRATNNYHQNYNNHFNSSNGDFVYSGAPVLDGRAMQVMKNATEEKKEIRRMGNLCGAAILLYILFSYVISAIIEIAGVGNAYSTNSLVSSAVNILLSVFAVGSAFYIIGLKNKKNCPTYLPNKKMSASKLVAYSLAGTALCYIANYVNVIFVVFMSFFGFQLKQTDYPVPNDFASAMLYVISLALIPALVEEYAIRGVALQPLKKYSLRFAIVATSIVFGIMHGTLIQVPFAIMAGMALAWITIKTDSIIPAMIAHFMNNGRSALSTIIEANAGEKASTVFLYLFTAVIIVLGAVSLILIYSKGRKEKDTQHVITQPRIKVARSPYEMTDAKRYKAFLLTPTMIIAFVIMLIQTASTVEYVGI